MSSERESVTTVLTRRVRPGHERDYEDIASRAMELASTFPGHLAATVLQDPETREFESIYSFADAESLQRWLDSPDRKAIAAEAKAISDDTQRLAPLTGLETWFTLPHRETIKPPPRWKMWLVSVVTVYPVIVLLQAFVFPEISGIPLLLRAALLPTV